MKKTSYHIISLATLFLSLLTSGPAFGWHDKTHMAVAQAAGYDKWYNAAAADVTKTKAGDIEADNHWYNNNAGAEVGVNMVRDQARRYNDPGDGEGHLYGAILASLQKYLAAGKDAGKYAEYNMAFCAHYIGDLSMPFHNMPYGTFNDRMRHTRNDGIVEADILNNIGRIQKNMYEIKINSEADLVRVIVRLANISHALALKLEKEKRDLKEEEAYAQLSHSASFLKAALSYVRTPK